MLSPAISQTGTGILIGKVTKCNACGGIEGVSVTTNGGGTTVTAKGGYYMMLHPSGTFNVTFQKPGYVTKEAYATIPNGGEEELNVCLQPR